MDMNALQASRNAVEKKERLRLEFDKNKRRRIFDSIYPVNVSNVLSFKFHRERHKRFEQWKRVVLVLASAKLVSEKPPWEWSDVMLTEEMRRHRISYVIQTNIVSDTESTQRITDALLQKEIQFPFEWIEKVLRLLREPGVSDNDYELLFLLTLTDGSIKELAELAELPRIYLYHVLGVK